MSETLLTGAAPATAQAAPVEDKPAATETPKEALTPAQAALAKPAEAPAAPAQKEVPKPVEEKPAEAVEVVPEVYDLKLPEGSLLVADHVAKVAEFAKTAKLTNTDAQAILERDHSIVAAFKQAEAAQLQKLVGVDWPAAIKADKEIGGDKFNEAIEISKRAIDKYGSDSLKQTLNASGLGNNPELVRLVYRMAKAGMEDKLVTATATPKQEMTASQIFYPTAKKE